MTAPLEAWDLHNDRFAYADSTGSRSISLGWRPTGTGSIARPGAIVYQSYPVRVPGLERLTLLLALHRENAQRTWAHGRSATTVLGGALESVSLGARFRVPLSALDADACLQADGSLIAAVFRLRYAHAARPDLFVDLSPGRDPWSVGSLSVRSSWPGAHFPPGCGPDPEMTVVDLPELGFFPNGGRLGGTARWALRTSPGDSVRWWADWDDLDAIAGLLLLLRNPDHARAQAWLMDNATTD